MGVCFLTSAENYKALDLFEISAKGVQTEPFLQKLINDPTDSQVYINYYLKVRISLIMVKLLLKTFLRLFNYSNSTKLETVPST